jgi:transcriptional repressor NrdR
MKCPNCGNDEDRVIDSRPVREGHAIRRRRECSACGSRFTTYESVEEQTVLVVKTDGTREPFDRQKVFRGLSIACIKRPVTVEQLEMIAAAVEARVLAAEGKEVSSAQIGQWTLDELLPVDEVAYVRFASVFKRYKNLDEFVAELAALHPSLRISSQIN